MPHPTRLNLVHFTKANRDFQLSFTKQRAGSLNCRLNRISLRPDLQAKLEAAVAEVRLKEEQLEGQRSSTAEQIRLSQDGLCNT
jgi:hypothetical protein